MRRLLFAVLANVWLLGCGGSTEPSDDAAPETDGGAAGKQGETSGRGGAPVAGKANFGGTGAVGAVSGSSSGGTGNVGAVSGGGAAGSPLQGGAAGSLQGGAVSKAGSGSVGGTAAGAGGSITIGGRAGAGAGGAAGAGPDPSCPSKAPLSPTTASFAAPPPDAGRPIVAACKEGLGCDYDVASGCLCSTTGSPYCWGITDPSCRLTSNAASDSGAVPPADAAVPAPPPLAWRCQCQSGRWNCQTAQ